MTSAFLLVSFLACSQTCPTLAKNPWEWPSHSNWFIGNGLKGNFSGGSLVVSAIPNITSYEGTTGASDDKGNLLFLANGRLLWDASGNLKYSGLLEGNEGFMTNGSASQGVITVRHPLDTVNYYIFTVDDANQGTANGLNYFVFDRNGNPKAGPVSLGSYRTSEGITATKHANGIDLWVTVYASGTTNFYTYLITCTGVISTPVISPVAPVFSGQKERGGLAFSWDSKYFAQVHPDYYPDSDKEVSVYKFDNQTGIISDPHHISSSSTGDSPYDVLFSPDNSKLYFSTATGTLGYYDITSWNTAVMSASYTAIPGVSTGSHSAIEIGGDGNLYMATLSSGLGKLTGSLNAGILTYTNIAGATSNRGLPTMYLPPYEEPDIRVVGPFCVKDPSVDLSTTWMCSGLNAEDPVTDPNAYSGPGIINTGTGLFDPLIAGIGTHRIIFKKCSVDDTIFIVVKACACPDTSLSPIPPICANGSIDLNNYKITTESGTWSIISTPVGPSATLTGNTFHANNTVSGNYIVRFTLNNPITGCADSAERIIVVNPLPIVQATSGTISCYGRSAILTANGANTYTWSNSNSGSAITVAPSTTTSYTVTGIDINGCSNTASVILFVPSEIQLTIGKTDPTCALDGTAMVVAIGGTPGYSYLWNNGQSKPIAVGLTAGTYTVIVTDSKACTKTISVNLTKPVLPKADFNFISACFGTSVQFTDNSTAGIGNTITNFKWNFGEPSSGINNSWNTNIPPPHPYNTVGTFKVQLLIATDNGCVDSISKWIEVWPIPKVGFGSPVSGCMPVCANFIDSSGITSGSISKWNWNFNDAFSGTTNNISNAQYPKHCYNSAGKYDVTLTVESDKGCKNSLTKKNLVNVLTSPKAAFTSDPMETLIFNPTISFFDKSSGSPVSWHWDFGIPYMFNDTSQSTDPKWTYPDTGKFNVCLAVENEIGCSDYVCHPVSIIPYWTFYIPNAFTPNGDGINDFFNGDGYNIIQYQLWIFDRWGNMIYTTGITRNPESSIAWDGRANNGKEPAQQDVYVWKVELKDVFKRTHNYIGTVTIVR